MQSPVYLEPSLVPQSMRLGYTGKAFKAIACLDMTIPCDAGLWSGGSREEYTVVRLADGKTVSPVDHNAAPWDKRSDLKVSITPGLMVVKHSMFCGKDTGLTFYIHPDNVTAMLPKPIELNLEERQVLYVHACLQSFARKDELRYAKFDMGKYDSVRAGLVTKGLLKANGAITIAGKNASARHMPKE